MEKFYKVSLTDKQAALISAAVETYIAEIESIEGDDPKVCNTEEYSERIESLCDLKLIFDTLAFDAS